MNVDKLKKLALDKIDNDEKYSNRLDIEFKEIEKAGLWEYFDNIISSGKKFHNTKNLLCCYLWGICPENPIEKDLLWEQSNEMPDLDIDFQPEARNYIKKYCSETFGEDNVVSIANYNHFGIKSGIRDISRVMEVPLAEVNACTTKMGDDVNRMENWEKVVEAYPVLNEFEKKYPKVCDLVRKFNGRVRSLGMHAGGVVIASCNLTKTIPLVTRTDPKTKEKMILSSFAEGQARSDLKSVGLVKQDFLGLENLNYISTCLKIMEQRGKYDPNVGIFRASKDEEDWTDESYLNDKKCIDAANRGDLQLVFQFDSPGMRKLIKKGGVTRFDDLVAYTSIFRPGPFEHFADKYCDRKQGKEQYELHEVLEPILGKTYGCIIYQENLMQIMNKVGLISLQNVDNIRRAMAKKKEKEFIKFKPDFIEGGYRTLGWEKEKIEDLWNQMINFASYGFNKCITPDSIVETKEGNKLAGECKPGDLIKSYNTETKDFFEDEVIKKYDNGIKDVHEIELDNGYKIECTLDHEFVCEDGKKRKLKNILKENKKIICNNKEEVSFINICKIINVIPKGKKKVIDLEMKSKFHNFIANGIVVGNSHALAYTMVSSRCLYLKTYYPTEYFTAVLSHIKTGDDRIKIYTQEGIRKGIKFTQADINNSKIGYKIIDDKIYVGFDKIKGINKESEKIIAMQPFSSFEDYIERYGTGKKSGETLISCGAFDRFNNNTNLLLKYFEYRREIGNKDKGMNRAEFGKMYKELTESKSCPREMSVEFAKLFKENETKIPYERLLKLTLTNKFNFTNIDKNNILDYIESNKTKFKHTILSLNEFEHNRRINGKEIKDLSHLDKCKLKYEFYSFYIPDHPLDNARCEGLEIGNVIYSDAPGTVEGMISGIKKRQTKTGNTFYEILIEDRLDSVNVVLWGDQAGKYRHLIHEYSFIKIDIVPSIYSSWNLSKNGKIERIRTFDEMSEQEEIDAQSAEKHSNLINSLKEQSQDASI